MNKLVAISGFVLILLAGCAAPTKTVVEIKGDKWFFNDRPVNEGSPAEGLLMNVRMVNSVFEDRGDKMPAEFKGFDTEQNCNEFISRIPEYTASGVNCFTISLQGGSPGYEGAVNTAFETDGSLRKEYFERVARVIRTADDNSAAVILSCFYQRQHSHFSALTGKEAVRNALTNTVNWIKKNKFRNVIFEVSNEYRHGGYRNWPDGKWIASTKGQVELMSLAKSLYPGLLTGTSGMGDARLTDSLATVADYITIHFNSTSLEDFAPRISEMKKWGKPVICNEDDKLGQAGASACMISVINGSGWGFMHVKKNQSIPFDFEGIKDDTAVYAMMKNVSTPGFGFDKSVITQTSLLIISPNDGDIFGQGKRIPVRFSYLFPDTAHAAGTKLMLLVNGVEMATAENHQKQFNIELKEPGVVLLEAALTGKDGNVILKSRAVDIIIK